MGAIVWSAVVSAPREIDVHHLGNPLVICCFELDGVIVDPGPESTHRHAARGPRRRRRERILLTHIHFDHAGATGALVRRWPDVEVWVHERGAPHLIDPSRLTASAARLYGDDMERLWGEVVAGARGQPARPERRRDDRAAGASSTRPATPRTTSPTCTSPPARPSSATSAACASSGGPIIPPTPPPDIDIELWHASLETRRGLGARAPGASRTSARYDDVGAHIAAMHEALDRWAALALETDQRVLRGGDGGRDGAGARRDRDAGLPAGDAARHAVAGLDRYWSKKNAVDLGPWDRPSSFHARRIRARAWAAHGASSSATTTTTRSITWRTRSRATSRASPSTAATRSPTRSTTRGQAIVWSGHQEPAELYWEQLNDAGLTMAPLEQG